MRPRWTTRLALDFFPNEVSKFVAKVVAEIDKRQMESLHVRSGRPTIADPFMTTSKLSPGMTTFFTPHGSVQYLWASLGCTSLLASTTCVIFRKRSDRRASCVFLPLYGSSPRCDVRELGASSRVAADVLPARPVLS